MTKRVFSAGRWSYSLGVQAYDSNLIFKKCISGARRVNKLDWIWNTNGVVIKSSIISEASNKGYFIGVTMGIFTLKNINIKNEAF